MKTFTCADLRKFYPCYDPIEHLEEDKEYTIIDILDHETIPFEDKLWIILRTDYISERIMRLFAVWCYRQTLEWVKDPDPRSIEAANVAERFANNEATEVELSVAESTAWAAWAAESVKSTKSMSAAESVKSTWAAWATTWPVTVWLASWWAAESARSAARSAQKEKLREMILEGIKTGDTK